MALFLSLIEAETTQSLTHQRILRDRLNPLDAYNDFEFISRYRLTRYVFIQLHDKIVCFLNRFTNRSHSIPTNTQLAVALQFFATGSFQTVVSTAHGIFQPSVSRCIGVVSDALSSFAKEYITFPTNSYKLKFSSHFYIRMDFLWCLDASMEPMYKSLHRQIMKKYL